jgi:hypothetical protein
MWSLAVSTLQPRLKIQLNSMLFAKTLVRKDVASSLGSSTPETEGAIQHPHRAKGENSEKKDDDDFSSKAQVMTLMTTDVDRVSDMAWHLFSLIGEASMIIWGHRGLIISTDSPVEVVIGSIFLYKLLGSPEAVISPDLHLTCSQRCFFLFRFGGDVPLPPDESLCWEGRGRSTRKSYESSR